MVKKRVLIVSAVFPPEQVTSALMNCDLAKELSKEYDVTVLRPYPTRPIGMKFDSAEVDDKSFRIVLIDSYTHPQSELIGRLRESIDFGRKCAKYIKKHHQNIDFIYNDGWQLFGLYLVSKAAHKYGIPYMVPIQDIYPECLFTNKSCPAFVSKINCRLLFPIDKYYQKHAACVRTISEEMRDYLSSTRNIPVENYLVVNNWQNDEDFLKEYPKREDDGKLVFAYVGSINAHANVDLIIKAFVESNLENADLRIYGGGNTKDDCVELVNKLGAKNIVFDMVSRDKVAFVQSQADVLVLALPKGNGKLCLPSKITSYMLSGKPVLASVDEDSTIAHVILSESCGSVVPPNDFMKLAKAFYSYAHYPKEKLILQGRLGKKYAELYLSRKVNLNMVVTAINRILA